MDNLAYIEDASTHSDEHQMEPLEDFIVGLFVVVFDTKKGNLIEWQVPDEIDLTGVEFKALVSGSHTITQDFVYFRHQQYYGLSCFALKSVENEEERGARMKSVGILCTKYTSLHEHQEFLESQVLQHLESPAHYKSLTQYYVKYRHCPLQNNTFLGTPRRSVRSPQSDDLPVLRISHPIGCFAQFIRYFSENIFVLWKFVLLQKRILFFAPPPIGVQCYRVYCTGLLGSNVVGLLHPHLTHHLFYVSVCNLAPLNHLDSFVACTTEKILSTKTGCYDLYVNKQKLQCTNFKFKKIKRINRADKKRFKRLQKYSNEQLSINEDVTDDEKMYTRFFIEQNNRIFKILTNISKMENNRLTAHHIREMGLDPSDDKTFLQELIDLYNLNVVFSNSCCGCC